MTMGSIGFGAKLKPFKKALEQNGLKIMTRRSSIDPTKFMAMILDTKTDKYAPKAIFTRTGNSGIDGSFLQLGNSSNEAKKALAAVYPDKGKLTTYSINPLLISDKPPIVIRTINYKA